MALSGKQAEIKDQKIYVKFTDSLANLCYSDHSLKPVASQPSIMAAPTAINKASKIIGLTDAGKKIFPKILSFFARCNRRH